MDVDVVTTPDSPEPSAPVASVSRSALLPTGTARPVVQALACGSLFAGVIHAGLCPSHFQEAVLFGMFFALAATLQFAWAALLVVRPSRRLLIAGAAGNLLTIGVWAVSRTVGIPFGPTPWRPESVGLADVLTVLVEAAVAVGAIWLVRQAVVSEPQGPARLGVWLKDGARNLIRLLPEGRVLPDQVWAQRHKWIVTVLWLHVPGIFWFAMARHESFLASFVEASIIAMFGLVVARLHNQRRLSTVVTSVGLLTCSALLVRLSGGAIEMHFHYFVMVGVITLYQDWWPFLVAIAYVVLQHGLAGVIDPSTVYNHQSAIKHPWEWAGIHGLFILGMSSAGIASWRLNESFLTGVIERQEQLEEAQEVARLGGWERNLATGKTIWSAELFRLLGLDPETVEPGPETFFECIQPEDRAVVERGIAATWQTGRPFATDFRITRDDSVRWLHCRARATEFAHGKPSAIAGTIQEITERKDAEASLRETLSLLSATLDATADGILVVDNHGTIASFNQRFAQLWRLPDEILAARDDAKALAFVSGQVVDPEGFIAKINELYTQPDSDSQDLIEFHDGRTFERFSTPQRVGGQTVGRVWSFRDISDHKRMESELSHQAFHDSLTNLANTALLRDRVDHALIRGERHGTRVAVLFLDLDNFKTVNDSLGHAIGDELLVAVAERLRHCLRATDTAARLGGDEFAVLIEDVNEEIEVTSTAERIIESLQQPFLPGGREVFISASIGIAFGSSASTSDQLLRNGDLAMYTAKRRGKGCFQIYHAEMHATAVDRLELEVDLRRALAAGHLRVEYQPIFTLDKRAMVGVEALVRWQHPEKGCLPPASFIPLAEETGLIREIGRQVMMEACAQVREWQLRIPGASELSVSVNVSAHQLHHDDLVRQVKVALEASNLPAKSLVLEFTETAMMRDTEGTIRKLSDLKALGVRLAIDDFGTGYSSLSYLQRFPVDILKIDRAFVACIEPGHQESSLASAIVSLSKVLGLQAVAEGIETTTQAETLTGLGCGFAQGFLFSRPLAPEAVAGLLTAESAATVATV